MKLSERPIGEVVARCQTWDPRRHGTGDFHYIDLSSIDKDLKRITAVETYPCSQAPSRARQLVKTDDVLVATVRPNLNGVALCNGIHDGMTASTGYCVLRPKPETLDPRYLFQWVKTEAFIGRMVSVATGANYPAVSDGKVKESTIPLPPLAEQKRIAAILDAADALRAKRREALAQLDTLLQATFLDMFGDPVTNPKGWEIAGLESLIDKNRPITYGILKPGPYIEGGVPYVRVVDIKDEQVLTKQLRRTTVDIDWQYRRSRLKPGDLLMSIRGHVGRMAITPTDADGANITQDTARLAFADAEPSYVMQCISTDGMQQFMARRTKGMAVQGINLGDVKQLPIPVPPQGLQARFAKVVRSVEQQKADQRAHVAELDTLFALLQSRAFRGEL